MVILTASARVTLVLSAASNSVTTWKLLEVEVSGSSSLVSPAEKLTALRLLLGLIGALASAV
jgi:hypothetical protein